LFGLAGACIFAAVFYIYPLFAIKLPHFRLYSLLLTGLSLATGHLLNNPQAATLFVTSILFLKHYAPHRTGSGANWPLLETQSDARQPGQQAPDLFVRPIHESF